MVKTSDDVLQVIFALFLLAVAIGVAFARLTSLVHP